MRTNMKRPVSIIFFALILGSAVAQYSFGQAKIATTAAQFLGIPVGARASSMGGTFVAMGDDASLVYWNPGAIAQAQRSQIAFMNTDWLAGTKFRWIGGNIDLGDMGSVGVGITQLDYGEDEVTTVTNPEGTGERWSAMDYAISLSYSRRLTDRFSVGGSLKYINQRIWNSSASAYAMDLGLLFVTGFNGMRLGMSISNFGGDMQLDGRDLLQRVDIDPGNSGSNKSLVGKLKTDSWPVPLIFRVGVAMDLIKDDFALFTVGADAVRPNDNKETINVGAEAGFMDMFFIRGGYRSLLRDDNEEGLTLGGGIRLKMEGAGSVELNYSYQQFGLFGNLNTIGLGATF